VSELRLENVVKHYPGAGETVKAVDGITLTLAPGELVALYGPSGSGKTTLLQLAGALLRPDRGSVVFDGRDIARLPDADRTDYRLHHVGLVLQQFHLVPGASALDNAAIKLLADGLSLREARVQVRPWLARVGLESRADHSPSALSMGERQRVAIARALVNRPRLLLTDEPTGNLDSKRSREILGLLRDICQEQEIPGLLVTHDPQATAFARQVHTIQDGHLHTGLHAELAATWMP
jgi:putative ABC transport system ATP-binding protein